MSEQGEYAGPYREQGRPLGAPESPLIDFSEAERVERHSPLNYDLLNKVEGEVDRMVVTPPSPRAKALKVFATIVESQKKEFKNMLAEATKAMAASRAETDRAVRERDEARMRAARPASRAVPIPATQSAFNFGGSTPLLVLPLIPSLITPLLVQNICASTRNWSTCSRPGFEFIVPWMVTMGKAMFPTPSSRIWTRVSVNSCWHIRGCG